MVALENRLKSKLSRNWNSVRRAFLDLDTDYDGFLTEYELSRFLGSDVNLNDLKLLMQLRDTKGEGRIDFT